jgi:hypothetical protein
MVPTPSSLRAGRSFCEAQAVGNAGEHRSKRHRSWPPVDAGGLADGRPGRPAPEGSGATRAARDVEPVHAKAFRKKPLAFGQGSPTRSKDASSLESGPLAWIREALGRRGTTRRHAGVEPTANQRELKRRHCSARSPGGITPGSERFCRRAGRAPGCAFSPRPREPGARCRGPYAGWPGARIGGGRGAVRLPIPRGEMLLDFIFSLPRTWGAAREASAAGSPWVFKTFRKLRRRVGSGN